MATFTIITKNLLHQKQLNKFLDALNEWKTTADLYGNRSKEANEMRILAEREEWFFKMTCTMSNVCTTTLKRKLNLFPY